MAKKPETILHKPSNPVTQSFPAIFQILKISLAPAAFAAIIIKQANGTRSESGCPFEFPYNPQLKANYQMVDTKKAWLQTLQQPQ